MEQPEVRMLQRRDLGSPHTTIGELAHQTRMFFFPIRPNGRVFENTPRDQLLVAIGTLQRRLYAISEYAHESRVTDGVAEHSFLLKTRFCGLRKGVNRCHRPTATQGPKYYPHPFHSHPFL